MTRSCCSKAVLELAPDYQAARFDYAQVLVKRHLYQAAQQQAEKLLSRRSRQPRLSHPVRHDLRRAWASTSAPSASTATCCRVPPQPAELHLSIAHSLKTLGRREEAIAEYRAAAAARAGFGDAYWSLANLKTYRFPDEEIAADARRGGGGRDGARSTATTCASRSARRSRIGSDYAESFAVLRARQRAQALREPLPPGGPSSATRAARSRCARAQLFARQRARRRARDRIRSSSSACRAPARR